MHGPSTASNRGVGGMMFLDAAGRPWFLLDEQQQDVLLELMSVHLKDAVIAIEDHRFYLHPGIDPVALARAVVANATTSTAGRGQHHHAAARADAVPLQRAHLRPEGQGAALSGLLEVLLSKREILELVLEPGSALSGGVYGVESMAQKMLGKPASRVTFVEAAMIAGIIQAPALYSPWTHPDAATRRSHIVLTRMREEGKITAVQEAAARAERVMIQPPPRVSGARHGYAKEFLRQQFRDIYGGDNPPGWTVETTFVPEVQDAAEAAVRDGLKRLRVPGLEAALVAIDPATGNLLAMVGGVELHDDAVQPRGAQPAAARRSSPSWMRRRWNTGSRRSPPLRGCGRSRCRRPKGCGFRVTNKLEARIADAARSAAGLEQRRGRPAAAAGHDTGGAPRRAAGRPGAAGSAVARARQRPRHSAGTDGAYGVFPALGLFARPRGLVSVRSADGETLHTTHVERDRVPPDDVAFQMVSMLEDVVDRGTGSRVRALGVRGTIGGKTGTTSDYRDAWFVGFSSSVVAGVWVGFDQPRTIGDGSTGARAALPIWADFMRRSARRLPSGSIAAPSSVRPQELCRLSHQRPLDGCPVYTEYLKQGDDVPQGGVRCIPAACASAPSAPSTAWSGPSCGASVSGADPVAGGSRSRRSRAAGGAAAIRSTWPTTTTSGDGRCHDDTACSRRCASKGFSLV